MFRTNLPKQIMELPDYPYPGPADESYLSSQDVLNYFEEYAKHFNLNKYIKVSLENRNFSLTVGGLSHRKSLSFTRPKQKLLFPPFLDDIAMKYLHF